MTATVTEAPAQPALMRVSPTSLKQWEQCPLAWWGKYKLHWPEPVRADSLRGTLAHAVLERLFDLPPAERTPNAARALLRPEWERMVDEEGRHGQASEAAQLLAEVPEAERAEFVEATLAETLPLVGTYFRLEHPGRFTPAHREVEILADLPEGIRLKGFVDRVDAHPGGLGPRIVDYKSKKPPHPRYVDEWAGELDFQLLLYALAWWRSRGEIPSRLMILALGSKPAGRSWEEQRGYRHERTPSEADLLATERKVVRIVGEIRAAEEAAERGVWPQAQPNSLCAEEKGRRNYCPFKAMCPAYGGTLPEGPLLPAEVEG